MKVLNKEELAMLLYETEQAIITDEDRENMGLFPVPSWEKEAEFNKDDFRLQAEKILKKARVALK